MKYLKTCSFVGLVLAALAAFAGTASATILTSPAGTTYTGGLKLVSEGEIAIKNESEAGKFECSWTMESKVESHGAAATTAGKISLMTLTGCTNGIDIIVLRTGSLEFHTDSEAADGNGIVTWVGGEFTINYTTLGISCLYSTGTGITLGTLTGSTTTGSSATIDIGSVKIPRTGDSIFCGANGIMTGSFSVATPATLNVD